MPRLRIAVITIAFLIVPVLVGSAPQTPMGRALGAGGYHCLATGTNGSLWAWGLNDFGQLGDGTTLDRPVPTPSRAPRWDIVSLAAGLGHSLLLTRDGHVYACGRNDFGQLGFEGPDRSTQWKLVPGLDRVDQVVCGAHHSYALRRDGTVWGWGDNRRGQVQPGGPGFLRHPVAVVGLRQVRAVSAGATHGLALTKKGEVWAWGDGKFGALGPRPASLAQAPRRVPGLSFMVQVAAGGSFSLALDPRGYLWAWGRNDHGQLGRGNTGAGADPAPVKELKGVTWVAAGLEHVLARDREGLLWSWGDNNQGQLGHSAPSYAVLPRPVSLPAAPDGRAPWVAILGGYHTLLVKPGGLIYAFGANDEGQLGDWSGGAKNRPIPLFRALP